MPKLSHAAERLQFCLSLRTCEVSKENLDGLQKTTRANGFPDFAEATNTNSLLQPIAGNLRQTQRRRWTVRTFGEQSC